MQSLFESILKAQSGNEKELMRLVDQFYPLLKKYTKMLCYEDAYYDLRLKLIEVIKTIRLGNFSSKTDDHLLKYFKTVIEHHYLFLSQKQKAFQNLIPFSAVINENEQDESTYFLDKLMSSWDEYPQIDYDIFRSYLTQRETEVLYYFYLYHYPVKSIAKHYHISIPAVSQTKARAIKKLRCTRP
ncbi:MAG: sigma-70 family RNA polymerase sigma factor [Acetanaerobacterium sp.]